jgi:hypothetical protein
MVKGTSTEPSAVTALALTTVETFSASNMANIDKPIAEPVIQLKVYGNIRCHIGLVP